MSTSHKESNRSDNEGTESKIELSPFQTLQPELLSEIFLIASHSSTAFNYPHLTTEPCIFTYVCKFWRNVALSTPKLWSHIDIVLGQENDNISHHQMVSTWLTLSKNSPLCLLLRLQENATLPTALLESASRWQVIQISSDHPSNNALLHFLVDDIIPEKATRLYDLHLYNARFERTMNIRLSRFPNLRRLACDTDVVVEPGLQLPLEFFLGTGAKILRMMASLPSLTDLILYITSWLRLPIPTLDPAQNFNQLKFLRFRANARNLTSLLSAARYPAVHKAMLELEEPELKEEDEPALTMQLTDFFKRSPKLTKYQLEMFVRNHVHALKTLHYANSITHLDLALCALTDDGLRALDWDDSREENCCPNLEVLGLHMGYSICLIFEEGLPSWHSPDNPNDNPPSRISLKQLVRTIQSRLKKNKSVKVHIHIRFYSSTDAFLENDVDLCLLKNQGVLKLSNMRLDVHRHG